MTSTASATVTIAASMSHVHRRRTPDGPQVRGPRSGRFRIPLATPSILASPPMPTYDYRCKACGHEFELFQSMTAPVQRKCPACSKLKLERLIGTGAGIIFKGGGFYETDYRSDAYSKAADADRKAAEAKPAETKSDGPADMTGKTDKTGKTDAKTAGSSDTTSAPKPANDATTAPRKSPHGSSRTTSVGAAKRKPAASAKPAKARRAGR